jgi:hypothetical protein
MYGSGGNSNSIDGGGGNDHITIIGRVDGNNVIKGGTGGVEEGVERDILHIDQNNMADIIQLSNMGKSANKETISGFETLLLDMTDGETLNLSSNNMLNKLTHINVNSAEKPNDLIINGKVTGVTAAGLVQDNSAPAMDGYTAYTTNTAEDIHVYIQQEIALITGG